VQLALPLPLPLPLKKATKMGMLLALASIVASQVGAMELATRHAMYGRNHRTIPGAQAPVSPLKGTPGSANCTTRWKTQPIDHFSWAGTPTGALTYQQRYLTYDKYWRNDTTGMIMFYVGEALDSTQWAPAFFNLAPVVAFECFYFNKHTNMHARTLFYICFFLFFLITPR
jgi:hypothetical protein